MTLKPIDILHVVHSLEPGGTERTLVRILQTLGPRPYRHAVVTLRDAGPLSAELPDHVACIPLRVQGRDRLTGLALGKLCQRHGVRVLHARNTGCWFDTTVAAALSPKTKFVLSYHGSDGASPSTARRRWTTKLARLTGAQFTSVSHAGRQLLWEQFGLPPHEVDVIPNGVDHRQFQSVSSSAKQTLRNTLDLPTDAVVVGTVGSLTPVKGHSILFHAASKMMRTHPKVHLLVIGEGSIREELQQLANTLEIAQRVRFTGHRADMNALLQIMDIYVNASFHEGLSNAVLEAMTVGLPLIVTEVGDHARLVHGKNGVAAGYVSKPGDIEELAFHLTTLADDPHLRRNLGHAARLYVQDYNADQMIKRYANLYSVLLDSGHQRPISKNLSTPRNFRLETEAGLTPAAVVQ